MKNFRKKSFKIIEERLSANQLSDMEMASVVGAVNLMCGADACLKTEQIKECQNKFKMAFWIL